MFEKLELGYRNLDVDMEAGSVRVYIFGGAAVHLYTNARGSGDIDAEVVASEKLELSDLVITYEDENGEEQLVVWDANFTPTLGPLHDEYIEDSRLITMDEEDIVWVYLVSPVDLAVSKLGRCAEHDISDICHLASARLITEESLEDRANEAISYAVGNEVTLKGNLREALEAIRGLTDE